MSNIKINNRLFPSARQISSDNKMIKNIPNSIEDFNQNINNIQKIMKELGSNASIDWENELYGIYK